MTTNLLYVATTMSGLEAVLEQELIRLGAENTKQLRRAVSFEGDESLIYYLNLWSRLSLSILVNISNAKVYKPDDIYDAIMNVYWDKYMGVDDTFSIQAVANNNEFINNSLFLSLRAKDAIVDQFRNKYGRRPSVDKENADLQIHLHLYKEKLNISLNTSGVPLFKRGYKTAAVYSPLNEVLAAGIIDIAGWNGNTPLFDPFCGSGTIAVEAAIKAANLAPGIFRNDFGFMKWRSFDKQKWNDMLNEVKEKVSFKLPPIYCSDISTRAIQITTENIRNAGMGDFIKARVAPFGQFIPDIKGGQLITNPPYGVRTDDNEINELYRNIGELFKKEFNDCYCWVIAYDNSTINALGLRANSKTTLFNGSLECKLLGYKIYAKK